MTDNRLAKADHKGCAGGAGWQDMEDITGRPIKSFKGDRGNFKLDASVQ